jgi:dCMP deaminase
MTPLERKNRSDTVGTSVSVHSFQTKTDGSFVNHDFKESELNFVQSQTPGAKRFKVTHDSSAPASMSTKLLDETNDVVFTSKISQPQECSLQPVVTPSSLLESVGPSHEPKPLTCSKEIASLLWKEAGYCSIDGTATTKRSDYITWDDYFMSVAALSAYRSKDPCHATGACIVDSSNRIIGIGYNGFPSGCSDDVLPWEDYSVLKTDSTPWLHTKAPYIVHAEVNAILNKCASDCNGARLYTPYFPCNECAKIIVQSRIVEVVYVYEHDSYSDFSKSQNHDRLRASRILLSMGGVRMRQYSPACKKLYLNFWEALGTEECLGTEKEQEKDVLLNNNRDVQVDNPARLKFSDLLWDEAKYDVLSHGSSKKQGYLSWDNYFMSMAFLTARRSKDPNTQVGACLVDNNKRILGLGYNGFPSGCSDDSLPWAREAESELHKKYMYVCHAEVNAVLNKGSADVRGATLFVALFPCNDCSKVIIQAGIREVVFMSDRYRDTDSSRASRILLQMAGIKTRKYVPNVPAICIQI